MIAYSVLSARWHATSVLVNKTSFTFKIIWFICAVLGSFSHQASLFENDSGWGKMSQFHLGQDEPWLDLPHGSVMLNCRFERNNTQLMCLFDEWNAFE